MAKKQNYLDWMHDMEPLAREVSSASDLEGARGKLAEMVANFAFTAKKEHFLRVIKTCPDRARLDKIAWDIVLRGEGLQVL